MADKLATLIRLHRWRLDEQRRLLGEALRRLGAAEDRVRALEQEIRFEQQSAGADPEAAGFAYGAYALVTVERREAAAREVAEAETRASERRMLLAAAWRSLRTFELAEESRRRRREEEAARRERLMLDEIAILARTRADAAARRESEAGATPSIDA